MVRAIIASFFGVTAAILGFTGAYGITGSWVGAGAFALVAGAIVSWRAAIRPIDPGACSRGLAVIAAVVAVLGTILLGRLAVFMIDSSKTAYSLVPASDWDVQHSCLTAYHVSAGAASDHRNIYDDALFTRPDDDGRGVRKPLKLGQFNIDVYEYPPPFLLLPRLARLVTPEFSDLRMLWFALNGGIVLVALLVVASLMGPAAGTRVLLLAPLVMLSYPTLNTLQKGNVQILVVAASIVAMVLFERRRFAFGGGLLAFATVSKLYPGLLIVYLMAQRRWRAVAWTAAMIVAWNVATVVDLGWDPYRAFREHLPGLLGGEAFPALRNPAAIANNLSVPGIVFKLKLFGVEGMSFPAAKLVGWIWTLVAVAATVWFARQTVPERHRPLVWMSILILATLRSPFLPLAYATFPPLWLLTLIAALQAPSPKTLGWLLAGVAALNVFLPIDLPIDPRLRVAFLLLPQALTMALPIVALRLTRLGERVAAERVAREPGMVPVSAPASL